jgi:hypothetical protein
MRRKDELMVIGDGNIARETVSQILRDPKYNIIMQLKENYRDSDIGLKMKHISDQSTWLPEEKKG